MYKLQCPSCKNLMNYDGKGYLRGKRKVCVYCGKSFVVIDAIRKQF